jgi:hypothetical protein
MQFKHYYVQKNNINTLIHINVNNLYFVTIIDFNILFRAFRDSENCYITVTACASNAIQALLCARKNINNTLIHVYKYQ